ncbi:hypothetical protein D3C87_1003780 [compost metagenome]
MCCMLTVSPALKSGRSSTVWPRTGCMPQAAVVSLQPMLPCITAMSLPARTTTQTAPPPYHWLVPPVRQASLPRRLSPGSARPRALVLPRQSSSRAQE